MSAESGFTPGPWAALGWRVDGGGQQVARCELMRRDPVEDGEAEARANARLIAASPTMFDYIARHAEAGDPEAASILEKIHAAR